jgi:hypothetical protein
MTLPPIFVKPPVLLCCLLLFPALLPAQTAADMDLLLDTPELSCVQAAWVVLEAAEALPGDFFGEQGRAGEQNRTEAFRLARRQGWLPRDARMEDPISLRDLSLLVMEAFRLRGGLMYSLFHNSRYAYRELIYRQIIQGRADPGRSVSGERLLRVLGRVLSYIGDDEDLMPEEGGYGREPSPEEPGVPLRR